ncbi:MAG TPA: Plug domain-containing protein, partial [Bacteroidales bacterium]|nr:Plug domain-containing protein [Bacteroidales bacterium]
MKKAISFSLEAKPVLICLAFALSVVLPGGTALYALTDPVAQEYTIEEITVLGRESKAKVQEGKLVQEMDSSLFQALPFLQLADALKFFTGVSVKDYGGLGGLKTISVRSLGAHHTALSYDGLPVTDVQNGQIDLGRFALDALESISLSTGQTEDIFQPARLFASAGLLQLQSLKPGFAPGKKQNLRLKFQGGSFGLLNPSLL